MPNNKSKSLIMEAVRVLKRGGVVVYPTDTAYGFAADATSVKAINKLFALKGRDFSNPISVIFPERSEIGKRLEVGKLARHLMEEYWPGGLTLVMPFTKSPKISRNWALLSSKRGDLGVREPSNAIAIELVKKFGKPITATSANLSGQPSTYSIGEVKKQYLKSKLQPDCYLDGGKLQKNSISTVIQIEGKHVTLLRQGVLDASDLLAEISIFLKNKF